MKAKLPVRRKARQKRGGVALRRAVQWLKRNRLALQAYNAHIEWDGVFSDGLRLF